MLWSGCVRDACWLIEDPCGACRICVSTVFRPSQHFYTERGWGLGVAWENRYVLELGSHTFLTIRILGTPNTHAHTHTPPVYTYAHMCSHSYARSCTHSDTYTHTQTYTRVHTLRHAHTHVRAHVPINTLTDVHTSTHIYILISYLHVLLRCSPSRLTVMPQSRNEKGRE